MHLLLRRLNTQGFFVCAIDMFLPMSVVLLTL
jgi:hypothetical protein